MGRLQQGFATRGMGRRITLRSSNLKLPMSHMGQQLHFEAESGTSAITQLQTSNGRFDYVVGDRKTRLL